MKDLAHFIPVFRDTTQFDQISKCFISRTKQWTKMKLGISIARVLVDEGAANYLF